MERDSHDSVCEVESLLDSVAMVNIYVDIQDPRVVLEQLQDRYDDVVYVAKPGRLKLLGVVEPSRPVYRHVATLGERGQWVRCYGDVTHPTVEFDGSLQRSSGVDGAEVIQTRKYRTVRDKASYIDLENS